MAAHLPEHTRRALILAAAEELGERLGGVACTGRELEAFLRGQTREQLHALTRRGEQLARAQEPPPIPPPASTGAAGYVNSAGYALAGLAKLVDWLRSR